MWVFAGSITDVSWKISMLGVPFALMGAYGWLGHYLFDARQRTRLVYGVTNRRLLVATSARMMASPSLRELRAHVIKRGTWGHLRITSPRLEVRAVPDVDEVQRLILAGQDAPPESAPASTAP
jgi:hypothetical protein